MIPAKPQMNQQGAMRRLNVAAYCRVSTDEEEQLTSYEAQRKYYTDKIMSNPEWNMAGIFADEGITGKDIVAKGVTFTPSQRLSQVVGELTFECDGIVANPLSDTHAEEALAEYFDTRQYINTRTFAAVCKCSLSSAYRRIEELVAKGKLKKSPVAKGLYEQGE
jgi:hypothetical protein